MSNVHNSKSTKHIITKTQNSCACTNECQSSSLTSLAINQREIINSKNSNFLNNFTNTPPSGAENDQQIITQIFRINNLDCAVEENEIRKVLEKITEIKEIIFNLSARTLTLSANKNIIESAISSIRKIGFNPEAISTNTDNQSQNPSLPDITTNFWHTWGKLILALILAISAEGFDFYAPESIPLKILGMSIAAIGIWLAGFSVYAAGFRAIIQRRLNINALMSVAVTGAFLIGQWQEAAMVMALYAIAEAIESRAIDRARNAIKSLLALAPEKAEVLDDNGKWQSMSAKDVTINAIIRIRPGERIPLDGIVTNGQSAIDQSPVTGESLPIDKTIGDEVYAGTINQAGALEIKVSAPANNSTLARIIQAVEQAQATRAPTQRFVDHFSSFYTPIIFILALAIALLTPWLLGWGWIEAIYKALVLLVIACPCALVISTPITVVSGLTAGARRGILIKGGVYLESARKIAAVALDKTGTITTGKPKLVDFSIIDFNNDKITANNASPQNFENKKAIAVIAKSLANRSDHPVSQALAMGMDENINRSDNNAFAQKNITELPIQEVQGFKALLGHGVQGHIHQKLYTLANSRWADERNLITDFIKEQIQTHENLGRTVSILADEQKIIAICAVADTIKDSSKQAISELQNLKITTIMLTGDNLATANTVGAQAGISEIHSNLLPENKLSIIDEIQTRYGFTAMAGDGINDAPALAKSNLSFAMGYAGTHSAMEAADVLVMNDDLRRIPEMIRLSRRTNTILWENITLALGIKLVFMFLAIFSTATMWMAVFADMGASLLVIFNGLRLLQKR